MNVVFFDSQCSLCQRSVHFLQQIDIHKRMRFEPLESPTARDMLGRKLPNYLDMNTIVYWENGRIWIRSRAILRILWRLGGKWRLIGWLSFLPISADWIYKLVAKHRHSL